MRVPHSIFLLFFAALICVNISAIADDGPAPVATPAAAAPEPCPENFAKLIPIAENAAQKVNAVYKYNDDGVPGFNLVNSTRDKLTGVLEGINRHDYPIVALDDATSVNAYAVAKDAFGDLAADQKNLLSVDGLTGDAAIADIKTNIGTILDSVETYPARIKAFIDETSTMQADVEFFEKFLEENPKVKGGIHLDIPVITTDEAGKATVTTQAFFKGTRIGLENQVKDMKKQIAIRLRKPLYYKDPSTGKMTLKWSDTNNIAMAQAVNVRRLETYHDFLESEIVAHPGKTLPADLQAMYDRIGALYKSHRVLKDGLSPPDWAWQDLNWLQFAREALALYAKDAPRIADTLQNNNIIQFIKNMTPEEQRAIGIGNAAKAAGFVGQTKWAQFIGSVTTGGSAVAAGTPWAWNSFVMPTYQLLIADNKAKEGCAVKTTDADFTTCTSAYLQSKYPLATVIGILKNKLEFTNLSGTANCKSFLSKVTNIALGVTDFEKEKQNFSSIFQSKKEKMVCEINDLIARRAKLAKQTSLATDSQTVLADLVTSIQKKSDPTSNAYCIQLLTQPQDQEFVKQVMEPAFLPSQFPAHFGKEKANILAALAEKYGSDKQKSIMTEMTSSSPDIATKVQSLLDDRNNFRTGQALAGCGGTPAAANTNTASSTSTSTATSTSTGTSTGGLNLKSADAKAQLK